MQNLSEKKSPPAKKTKRLDILKTFEIFSKEKVSVFGEKLIEIILVEADNIFAKNKRLFNIDFKKNDAVQVSVINDRKTFDLLSIAWKRQKIKQERCSQADILSLPVKKG